MPHNLRAVLDIGSNTIRLLIAELKQGQLANKVHYQHHIARLGQGLQQTGQLSDAGQERALEAFQSMIESCQKFSIPAADIVAVATAAVREAGNGQAFVDVVLQKTGLKIHVIAGEVEAKLALDGAVLGLAKDVGQDMLLFDIGGGSTEFTRVHAGNIKDSISMKLGVVRLAESHFQSDPLSTIDYQATKDSASRFLDELEAFWGHDVGLPQYLVGTAGTVTTLAAIVQDMRVYDASKIDGYSMSRETFEALRDMLLSKTNEQRLNIPALEKGREDVIVAGLAIIDVMFERWGYQKLISVDSGLLMGLLDFSAE